MSEFCKVFDVFEWFAGVRGSLRDLRPPPKHVQSSAAMPIVVIQAHHVLPIGRKRSSS